MHNEVGTCAEIWPPLFRIDDNSKIRDEQTNYASNLVILAER